MKYLALLTCALLMLHVLTSFAGEKNDEPTLEWTLRYMVREIPEDTRESLRDAASYTKHRKDFSAVASISLYTKGYNDRGAMVKASSGSGIIYFALVPDNKSPRIGRVMLYGAFKTRESDKHRAYTQWLFDPSRDIIHDEEIKISSGGGAITDPKKHGQFSKGRVGAWILTVKKANGDMAKLVKDSFEIHPRPAKEALPPLPKPEEKNFSPRREQ